MKQSYFIKKALFAFCMLFALSVVGQTVKGKVVDSNGEALPYVNVIEKGTTSGTTTDDNGDFSLNVSNLPATLMVSSIGYSSVEQVVNSTNSVTITLSEDSVGLDEVVLVGTRSKNRTVFDSAVPVDVIDVAELASAGPQVSVNDILNYVADRKTNGAVTKEVTPIKETKVEPAKVAQTPAAPKAAPVQVSGEDEIIPLSRMGKLIAHHMTASISTSAHVQSFIEVDVTNLVNWRNKVKNSFQQRESEKLTFTPIFMEAVAMAIKKFPMINISLDGGNVIKKKNINIGMAAALPDGNLIVPVIKNADQLNLVGMAKVVNDLAGRSRNNNLKPDEVQGGTYTVTNVGTFGSVFGTPIINQPQVAILALGAIRKVPSVIETPEGDFIGIRSKMFLSHSYDHRVVNGALGGMFIKEIANYLEAWDINREI